MGNWESFNPSHKHPLISSKRKVEGKGLRKRERSKNCILFVGWGSSSFRHERVTESYTSEERVILYPLSMIDEVDIRYT